MKNVASKVLMMFVMSFMLFNTCSYAMTNEEAIEIFKNSDVIPSSRWNSDEVKYFIYRYSSSDKTKDYFILCFLDTSMPISYTSSTSPLLSSIIISQEKFNEASWYINSDFSKIRLFPEFSTSSRTISYYRYLLKSDSPNTVIDYGYNNKTSVPKCIFSLPSGVTDPSFIFFNDNCKIVTDIENCTTWDGESYYYQASVTPDTPSSNLIDSVTFNSMISDLTQSELFYQNVPSSHRKYFFVQYDVEKDRYIFYFYPSNYSIQGLLMNENDYYLISSEDFSWWENVVNFVQGLFKKENEEGFDYKMVYASVLEDGSFDYWFRNKSNEILDKTLFNFDNSPLVFSMVDIPFFGKHSGGGIDLDTGDKTLASSPESSLIGQTFEENPLELNPNPITEVAANEQSFWDKVLNRLSSITSGFLCLPGKIADAIGNKMGFNKVMFIVSPLFETIYEILGVFLACLAFIGRAITFVYTLPTIEPSAALFSVDVDTNTKGLAFTGNTWGTHFLSGLDKLKAYSWNGITLWSFFEAFVLALVAVIAIKLVRKHYHM